LRRSLEKISKIRPNPIILLEKSCRSSNRMRTSPEALNQVLQSLNQNLQKLIQKVRRDDYRLLRARQIVVGGLCREITG
jgi:hypothetical protein